MVDKGGGGGCSSSTRLHWVSMHVLSSKSCWGDGRVERGEAVHLEEAPLSTALLISFALLILHCQVNPTRKSNKTHSSELIHAWYWQSLPWCKANTWYKDGICTKSRTTRHIHNYLCILSKSNLIKLQAIQVRHHMQYAREYHTAKLEKAPGMLVSPEDRHKSLPYFFLPIS